MSMNTIALNHTAKCLFDFDDMVYLSNDKNIDKIFTIPEIKYYSDVKITTGTYEKNDVNLLVPNNEKNLNNIFKLKNIKTKKQLELKQGQVIISDKLAELSNTNVGDYISFTDSNGKTYKFKISDICENYVGHYIIMNKDTFINKVDKYSSNIVFYRLNDIKNDDMVSKKLFNNSNVMSVLSMNTTKIQVDNMLRILDSVVLILIFLSGGLSIVVLYNLSFINVSERRREIATLKVLGFTHKEVDNYINKETIILTVIGIVFGLIFGIFLSNIIISTVEISMVRFIHKINIFSYIYTSLFILLFTLVINISTHFSLKKIDMIESLKSVE